MDVMSAWSCRWFVFNIVLFFDMPNETESAIENEYVNIMEDIPEAVHGKFTTQYIHG